MEPTYIKSILSNLDRLVMTNGLLAEAHHKALTTLEVSQSERNQLISACREIYEGLDHKAERSIAEESWYNGLREVLIKSNRDS